MVSTGSHTLKGSVLHRILISGAGLTRGVAGVSAAIAERITSRALVQGRGEVLGRTGRAAGCA